MMMMMTVIIIIINIYIIIVITIDDGIEFRYSIPTEYLSYNAMHDWCILGIDGFLSEFGVLRFPVVPSSDRQTPLQIRL